MKAEELRIGNLISFDSEITIKVCEIQEKCFYAKDQEGIEYKNTTCELKPIELTEEWLLRFGFFIKDKAYSLNYGGESMRYAFLDIPRNPFILWFHGKYGFNTQEGRKSDDYCIKYVHQLQNLYFALTQKELTLTKSAITKIKGV